MRQPNLRVLTLLAAVALPVLASADAPTGRYTITNGGTDMGTVYDQQTKLTWTQAGHCAQSWSGARAYCARTGEFLGGSGWRVPTIKELMSIVDYSRSNPAIDSTAFPSTSTTYYYWSSTRADSSSASSAWFVQFVDGAAGHMDNGSSHCVRCVR